MEKLPVKAASTVTLIVVALVGVFILLSISFTQVNPGERAFYITLGKADTQKVLSEGLYIKLPFVQTIQKMTIKIQKNDIRAEAASKDLQTVNTDTVVNWHLNDKELANLFINVGSNPDILERIIIPAVQEVVKASTAKKTAEEIITKRGELKAEIDTSLVQRLGKYGVILDDLSLVDIQFSPEFNQAIEQKQIAEQNAKRAVFTTQQAEQDAKARVAKAKGEAETQNLLRLTLTSGLLQKQAIEKWDGRLPTYWTQGTLPFVNIGAGN